MYIDWLGKANTIGRNFKEETKDPNDLSSILFPVLDIIFLILLIINLAKRLLIERDIGIITNVKPNSWILRQKSPFQKF